MAAASPNTDAIPCYSTALPAWSESPFIDEMMVMDMMSIHLSPQWDPVYCPQSPIEDFIDQVMISELLSFPPNVEQTPLEDLTAEEKQLLRDLGPTVDESLTDMLGPLPPARSAETTKK